ncbi:GIN domain-containing protein, partial [Bacteroidota bacterium]
YWITINLSLYLDIYIYKLDIMKRETRLFSLIILSISVLLLLQFRPIIKKDPVETRVMELPDFQRLEIDVPYNVFLVEGEVNSIVVEGPGKEIEQIFYEMKDTLLNIQYRQNQWLKDWITQVINYQSDINVYVTVKDLSQINVTSSKAFSIKKKVDGDPIGWIIKTTQKVWNASHWKIYYV